MSDKSVKEYYDTLPRKRNAVGVLIIKDDKILIVKPTYKEEWLVPGGVVEAFESIHAAAIRECEEEIGITPRLSQLLVTDYKPGDPDRGDAIHFLFEAFLPENFEILLNRAEIEDWKWANFKEADSLLGPHLRIRVTAGLTALQKGKSVYCQDGEIIF